MDDDYESHCFAPPPSVLNPQIAPVALPQGKISKETLTDIAQDNVGLAFNRIVSIAQSSDDKVALQAAKEVIEIAHPKKHDALLNINMMPTRIELVVVPLPGDAARAPIVLDVDATRKAEPSDGAGGS